MKKPNKKGFTLLELIGAMIIIAILTIAGSITAVNAVKRANIDATAASLQVFASDMESILEDVGVVEFTDPKTDDQEKVVILEYLALIESNYTHTYFDKDTLKIEASRFTIHTRDLQDAWDSKFTLIYNTDPAKGVTGTCILASPGPNLNIESEGYGDGLFSDDILLITKPKT